MPAGIRKTVKLSLLILGITVLALVLAPFFIDAGDFKPLITRQAEQVLGRKVVIGDISASLFPWVGVRLGDVSIANREGFSDRPLLTIKHLNVEMALLPLFSKRIEIRRFVLDAPHLVLERNSQGLGNWQNGPPAAPAPPAGDRSSEAAIPVAGGPGPAGFALASLTAEAMNIHQGKLSWLDAATGVHTEVTSLELSMDSVRLDSPIPVSLTGLIGKSGFSLEGRLGPVRDLRGLDMARLPVQAHLKAKGLAMDDLVAYVPRLAPYRGMQLDMDARFEQRPDGLRLSAGTARIAGRHEIAATWKAELPSTGNIMLRSVQLAVDGKQAARVRGEVHEGKDGIAYELRLSTPALSRGVLATWIPQIETLYAGHVQPWRQLQLGMLFSGSSKHLDLRDLQLLLDGELVQASGTVHFDKHPDIRLRIAAGSIHADPWIPATNQPRAPVPTGVEARPVAAREQAGALIAPARPQSVPPAQAPAQAQTQQPDVKPGDIISRELVQGDASGTPEPDLRFLAPWRVAVQIQVGRLFVHGLELRHLRASLQGRQGVFELRPMTFELSGGQVREHVSLDVSRYPVRWKESSEATGVRLEPVVSALADKALISGVAEFSLKLSGNGLLPEAALHTLSGSGNIRIRDGQVLGFDVPGILQSLKTLGRGPGPKVTGFSQLVGSFVIHHGIVENDDLFMASSRFRLTGRGRIDLTQLMMDYHIKPRLIGAATGQGDTAGVRKGMTVPIHLVGPIAGPQVKLEMNIQDLMENVQGVLEEIKRGGGAKGVRKVLEGLFPGI